MVRPCPFFAPLGRGALVRPDLHLMLIVLLVQNIHDRSLLHNSKIDSVLICLFILPFTVKPLNNFDMLLLLLKVITTYFQFLNIFRYLCFMLLLNNFIFKINRACNFLEVRYVPILSQSPILKQSKS